jgi:putative hydrolase
VAAVNDGSDGFRLLTGIEVDILEDGGLDQAPEVLEGLDIVVASVHSKLRSDRGTMTRRMLRAIANPQTNVLGHCTGRLVQGSRGTRPGIGVRRRTGLRGLRRERRGRGDQFPA